MKTTKIFSRILDVLILLVFILFFASAGFQDKSTSGWYQQWFPNLNGSTIKDITFLDSLTGFAVTTSNSLLQEYILRTTNGGDNWSINYTFNTPSSNRYFFRVIKVDSNTVYAFSWTEMFKTTNRGNNWALITYDLPCGDFAVLNKDTILGVSSGGFGGGVWRTTNGGLSWQNIWSNGGSGNPDKIYMYDRNMGFSCAISSISFLRKTTNGGFNWSDINITDDFLDMKFVDTLTGWKGTNSIKKTTDGGITWFQQASPNVLSFIVRSISIINKDSVWLGGDAYKIIGNTFYGALCKTTNGGTNWDYQIPNMAIDSGRYLNVNFIDTKYGWAYINETGFNDGVHTKVGGNDTTISGVNNNSTIELFNYQLFQNYPNPFNPTTTISYILNKSGNISIKVFDISGKEIEELVNKRQQAGSYKTTFNGSKHSSGIYFYSLIIDGKVIDTKKMMYVK